MSFWSALFSKKPTVRILTHVTPFDFRGIDRFGILEQPISEVATIPFKVGPIRESLEAYDSKRHFVMDGRIPDTIHRFARPNGVPLDFLIKNGRIIQVTDNTAAYQ
jgi:hypothetical protein